MTIRTTRLSMVGLALAGTLVLSGCVLTPEGTEQEQARLDEAGRAFEAPIEKRALPPLSAEPEWRELLQHAFYSNGELEAAYFDWKSAMKRIPQAAGWPNSNLNLGFDYMFSSESMKAWDRTTVSAGPDPMQGLSFPTKVAKAGEVALHEAQVAGERFRAAKFGLQQRVLSGYVDYALQAERARIAEENAELLKLLYDTARQRVEAGAPQEDLLRAEIEHRMAGNELANARAELPQMRAMLNALAGRPAQAPLPAPDSLPAPRAIAADDAALIAVATDANPELAALAHEVAGREDALELARMRWIPDISPTAAFTGSISQALGAMVSVPTQVPQIRGAIAEAKANLRQAQAVARQTDLERGAGFVAALYALRNAERQAELFENTILPAARRTLENVRQSYAAGQASFTDLVEAQRTLLEVRLTLAEARAAREKRLAELEALAGVDIETLNQHAAPTVAEVSHD